MHVQAEVQSVPDFLIPVTTADFTILYLFSFYPWGWQWVRQSAATMFWVKHPPFPLEYAIRNTEQMNTKEALSFPSNSI